MVLDNLMCRNTDMSKAYKNDKGDMICLNRGALMHWHKLYHKEEMK